MAWPFEASDAMPRNDTWPAPWYGVPGCYSDAPNTPVWSPWTCHHGCHFVFAQGNVMIEMWPIEHPGLMTLTAVVWWVWAVLDPGWQANFLRPCHLGGQALACKLVRRLPGHGRSHLAASKPLCCHEPAGCSTYVAHVVLRCKRLCAQCELSTPLVSIRRFRKVKPTPPQ